MKRKTIAILSSKPLEDKRNWSGTMYSMYQSIVSQGYHVVWVPLPEFSTSEEHLFGKIKKMYEKLFNRTFNSHQFILKAWMASRKTKKALKNVDFDVLFCPTYINHIAFLKIKQPIVFLNDANVSQLFNYYSYYSGIGFLSKKITQCVEKQALKNATKIIYSSDWASDFARQFYGIARDKVSTIKFGSNAEVPVSITYNKNYNDTIVFLFLAVFWERKGGDIALKAVEILKNKGYNVRLEVVGCVPPVERDVMSVTPFLNKNTPTDAEKIMRHLSESHFLFIPTRADCTPISFCEAAGYGLPVITTNTGGVEAHVEHQVNGLTLPLSAAPEAYALEIEKLLLSPEKMDIMAKNARLKYENELNWKVWGKSFSDKIIEVL